MFLRSSHSELAYRTVIVASISLAMIVGLLILYFGISAFFILFASLVVAAIFDGISKPLTKLGLPRPVALLFAYLLIFAIVAAPIALGGVTLVQQSGQLIDAVQSQFDRLVSFLSDAGLPISNNPDAQEIEQLLPSGLFSSASKALFSVLGGFGNLFIILFLAIFISWQPGLYRRGLVSLVPKEKRARFDEVLRLAAHSLVLWLAGVGISMVIVFTVSWIGLWAIGMPYAFLLALQAGFLAFIPTLGPFVAGAIIVLAAWSEGMEMALWALGVYLLIQGVESNIAEPIAQRFTSSIAPALMLGAQLLFGVLFGLLGVILVVPILALFQTLVYELYVKDVLGGPVEAAK